MGIPTGNRKTKMFQIVCLTIYYPRRRANRNPRKKEGEGNRLAELAKELHILIR